jgi:hypothetical protein
MAVGGVVFFIFCETEISNGVKNIRKMLFSNNFLMQEREES